jgi:hypothetical protein
MEGRPRSFELCANRLAVAIVTVQRRTDWPIGSVPASADRQIWRVRAFVNSAWCQIGVSAV